MSDRAGIKTTVIPSTVCQRLSDSATFRCWGLLSSSGSR